MSEETRQLDLMSPPETPDYLARLNEAQKQAVVQPVNQSVQVLAGAGTGKTELIAYRFVHLVEEMRAKSMARPEERVLVVTFTEDAAANMRERINKRLIEASLEPLSPRCWISTFHQFAGRLLRAHSLEVGLPPDFSILNPLKQQVLFNRVVQGLLNGDYSDASEALSMYGLEALPPDCLSPESLERVCPEQLGEVFEVERLRKILERIKASGLSPAEFYREGLAQVERLTERLKTLSVPHDPDSGKLENIQLKLDAWRSALSDWAHVDWNPIREAEAKYVKPTPGNYKDTVKYLAALYLTSGDFKPKTPDFSLLDEATELERGLIGVLAALYAVYQHALLREQACDFDDLINHTAHLLESNPRLQARYRGLFEHVIVDEFQDSNGSQLRLLQSLMRPDAPNLTVVGDIKQSIYGFRFAQPENMKLVFEGGQANPTIVPLQVNYRSHAPVLHVANRLTASMIGDTSQSLLVRPDWANKHAQPVRWIQLGCEEAAQEESPKGKPAKPRKEPIGPQKEREARFIAAEIARLALEEGFRFSDMAVLVKSHAKAERIQAELQAFGIPAIRRKNLGFFQEGVIKDAMALLRLMQNLHDDASLVRVLQSRLNQRQLRVLMTLKKSLACGSVFEVMLKLSDPELSADLTGPLREGLLDLVETLQAARRLLIRPCSAVRLFQRLSETVGIIRPDMPENLKIQQRLTLRTFEKLLYLFSQSEPVQPTLAEVIDTLGRYEADPGLELPVAAEQGAGQGENAVHLMTIHGAKGLEFPVVFVAYVESSDKRGADDARLLFDPQYSGKAGFGFMLGRHARQTTVKKELYNHCWQKPRSRDEQQRLFYVGLTRAEQRLYVVSSNHSPEWAQPSGYTEPNVVEVLNETDEADHERLEADYWRLNPAEWARKLSQQLDNNPAAEVCTPLASRARLAVAPAEPPPSLRLSFSALKTFDECPVRYWVRYQWKLPVPPTDGEEQTAVKVGSVVHAMIHRHYLQAGELNAEALLSHLLPEALVEDRQRVLSLYQAFLASPYAYERLSARGERAASEKRLRYTWVEEGFPDATSPNSPMKIGIDGVLDLLIQNPANDTHTLIDFKTNRNLSSADRARYFEQLRLYRQGLLKQYPEVRLPDTNLILLHLTPDGAVVYSAEHEAAGTGLIENIAGVRAAVQAGTLPKRPSRVDCRAQKCPYLSVCPEAR